MQLFAVLFDLDGLLLDTERLARAAWLRALSEHGYQISDDDYLRLVGRTVQDGEKIMGEIFGPEFPFYPLYNLRQKYLEEDIEQNDLPIKPGVVELLAFLDDKAVTRAIASSTPCWFASRKLARAGLSEGFQAVVCGDMVARGKPNPDLFLEAGRQVGFPAERCVVLEDSEDGILAASRATMLPLMVPDLKPPAPEIRRLAYRVLPSLHDAVPLIQGFLRDGLPGMGKSTV